MGAQSNGTHAQHGQRPQEWGRPQCKYSIMVRENIATQLLYAKILQFCDIMIWATKKYWMAK